MGLSLVRWWKSNVALQTFVYSQFLICLPFAVFNTYVMYQLQVTGYIIGSDDKGAVCTEYCIVEWAGSKLDLNSVLLYLNAFGTGLVGLLTLFLFAFSDCWPFSVRIYWRKNLSNYGFQILTGLNIVFAIVTMVLIAVSDIYIPHCMRVAVGEVDMPTEGGLFFESIFHEKDEKKRSFGFNMSIYGSIANSCGGIMIFVIVIVLTKTLPGTSSQTSPPGQIAIADCKVKRIASRKNPQLSGHPEAYCNARV
ncbi:hypothetical protein K431DRAFT_295163 [Polychaeton citri CBS 116435]|uniref:Autophagy-related protein n=1 Tax=Polychaeton citri CBS 116435 TaxID=1314669 RepID=A0A9P4Q8Q4_9PEZI|nr:hypothetical protein K431DRAFT_295163 [Polychaeton citri CBS 116435]